MPDNLAILNIGNPGNDNHDIQRQIRHGVNDSNLSYYGGELRLDDTTGNGMNAIFMIAGFLGVRIIDVQVNGG